MTALRFVVFVLIYMVLFLTACSEAIGELSTLESSDETMSSLGKNQKGVSSVEEAFESYSHIDPKEITGDTQSAFSSDVSTDSITVSSENTLISSSVIFSSNEGVSSSSIALSSSSHEATAAEKRAILNDAIDYVFNDEVEPKTFNILIDPADLSAMDAAPKQEVYYPGHLVFENDTIQEVEVRYKGSFGAWFFCTDGEVWDKNGAKTCIKLSMKVKFNTDLEPDRKFFGMKKIAFYHMHFYKDQLRDRLAYWMHREMGQAAPRVVHAKIKINDELVGLFAMIENIDGRFTRAHWDDGEGNVYKEAMPFISNKVQSDDALDEKLKTNEDENPTHTIWQGLEGDLLNAHGAEAVKDVLRKWFNVDELVNTVLTSAAIDHWDSPFYRDNGHNSYWYADTTEGKLFAIPWDMDNASFKAGEGNEYVNFNKADEIRNALQCNSGRTNKMAKYWLCFPDETNAALDKLLYEVYPQINGKIDTWVAQITDAHDEVRAAQPGSFPNTGALTYEEWQSSVTAMKSQLEQGYQVVKSWR
ncbi:MAG: CotH kinase family protein [Fibrobacterales bacterium]